MKLFIRLTAILCAFPPPRLQLQAGTRISVQMTSSDSYVEFAFDGTADMDASRLSARMNDTSRSPLMVPMLHVRGSIDGYWCSSGAFTPAEKWCGRWLNSVFENSFNSMLPISASNRGRESPRRFLTAQRLLRLRMRRLLPPHRLQSIHPIRLQLMTAHLLKMPKDQCKFRG